MNDDDRLRARVVAVLRDSSVFGTLDRIVIDDLADVLQLQTVQGGASVVREGDAANSMLFVITGGLRVSRRNSMGELVLYNEVRPGASFGEVGLILQQPRAADVIALRDSTLAVLHRSDYEVLLARHPLALNRVFVKAIYDFLRHTVPAAVRSTESVVVVPLDRLADASEVARGLTQAFSRMGPAHHVELAGHGTFSHADGLHHEAIEHMEKLESQFDFLVYEAQADTATWTRRAFRQADQVVFVLDSASPKEVELLERELMQEPGYAMKRRHLVVLHPSGTSSPEPTHAWRKSRDIERVYPTRAQHRGDYDRLARFLTGQAVGIVLGGGGARGFAHLGVLRALQESNIPIDLIGGNSMGALIGAQYACDWTLDEIREQTRKFALGGERPTLPLISLVSGARVQRDLKKMFGERAVDGMWRPFFAAACNLSKGCTSVQEDGPLWRAVLASNSPAGLFPPVLYHGDLLVDGAILENVPVGAMRMRLGTAHERRRGNGTIIAVDVDVQEELTVSSDLSSLSVWSSIKGWGRPKSQRTPGIGDILYRAGHIGGVSHRAQTVAQADHYLEPPVANFPMMGYRSAAEIAEVGYRYTMERIAAWKR